MTEPVPSGLPDPSLRTAVAAVDRLRRSRAAVALVAEYVPYAAGGAVLSAVAARWFGWSLTIPVVWLVGSAVALLVALLWARRSLEVSDAAAAELDARAEMGGELHSAHWFAGHKTRAAEDPVLGQWTTFHLTKAAAKVRSTDWATLYPPVQAMRQWLGSAALVAVAVIAIVVGPRSTAAILAEQGLTPADAELTALELLPADIQKKIDELLAAIKNDELTAEGAKLKMDEIRALLEQLNASNADEAARTGDAADAQPGGEKPGDEDALSKKAEELADSSAGLPEDVKWSIDDLASRLANADAGKRETNKDNEAASEQTGEKGEGSDDASQSEMTEAAGMQLVREAASDASEGQMMNGGGGAMGGDSTPGAGGNQGGDGPAPLTPLQQALRQ
ncbi:MAG: hypothetical protein HQ485_05710, partial [Acidobacteria bacterium]|nr:hypothetical protein [Acidobacteriota bacterium]